MRIGIDIRSLQNDSQSRGIGTYTRCLVKSLLALDNDNEYVFFAFKNQPLPGMVGELKAEVRVRKVTSRRKRFVWLSGQAFFPLAIRQERLDVFHSPEYIVPVFSKAKKVITVHDFINSDFELYRKLSGVLRRAYFYLKDKTLHHADGIIAISEYTKKKIIEFTAIAENKIKVIYEAADDIFRPCLDSRELSGLRKKYNINRDFLLYVGALDYHKNIDGLIKSFAKINHKDTGLVLIGVKNDPKYFVHIEELIKNLGLSDRVYILGYIPKEDLVGFYNLAKAVISVSFYEGFGLPIIEGMSCAKPVIAAGNTSMREIVGDAGILVNPANTDEIAFAIDKLLSDDGLNKTLSEKCLKRSYDFSWEKTAKETLALYQELTNL